MQNLEQESAKEIQNLLQGEDSTFFVFKFTLLIKFYLAQGHNIHNTQEKSKIFFCILQNINKNQIIVRGKCNIVISFPQNYLF